jgi:hypothetical protein
MHLCERSLTPATVFSEGQALLQRRQVHAAIECFNRAEEAGFDQNECSAARWNCWMLLGQFERAWQESDVIAQSGAPDPYRVWSGESWAGKRVLIRGLHGLGDTIQFIRYAPLLARSAAAVNAQVHPQILSLLEGVRGIDCLYTWGTADDADPLPWDVAMEVTELPRAFRSTISSIPCAVPYISIPARCRAWAKRIVGERRGFRIGLAWQTGIWNPARTIPLEEFDPLFKSANHEFYSLQKGAAVSHLSHRYGVRDIEAHAGSIQDTAALVLEMDLIITADTMTAHLAGALGRPVWILLPFAADWRWMVARQDSPWYPTASLFRQSRAGEWRDVIQKVQTSLRSLRLTR